MSIAITSWLIFFRAVIQITVCIQMLHKTNSFSPIISFLSDPIPIIETALLPYWLHFPFMMRIKSWSLSFPPQTIWEMVSPNENDCTRIFMHHSDPITRLFTVSLLQVSNTTGTLHKTCWHYANWNLHTNLSNLLRNEVQAIHYVRSYQSIVHIHVHIAVMPKGEWK